MFVLWGIRILSCLFNFEIFEVNFIIGLSGNLFFFRRFDCFDLEFVCMVKSFGIVYWLLGVKLLVLMIFIFVFLDIIWLVLCCIG